MCGGSASGEVSLWGGVQPGITVSHDHVMDGRGRSAFTLTKRTCCGQLTQFGAEKRGLDPDKRPCC